MSATAKILGAAGIGAFAGWLLDGDFSGRGFARLFGSLLIAGFMAVAFVELMPFLTMASESARVGVGGVVGSFAADVFKRITRADVSIKTPWVDAESNGSDEKDKLP